MELSGSIRYTKYHMNALEDTQAIIDFSHLNADESWSFRSESRSETSALTHSYHRYPAKFIPQIVDKVIKDYTVSGDLVVDPFGGCGTTLVESKLNGRNSIGFDINPIAKLITQTKITAIKPAVLEKSHLQFIGAYKTSKTQTINHHARIDYWFEKNIVKELDKIYSAINSISHLPSRRFYLCAFSHNLKNSSRWLMKSIKPTIDKNKNVSDPFVSINRHLVQMTKKNTQFYETLLKSKNLKTSSQVYKTDSTKKWPVKNGTIDLIITSPPYVTSYEYADLHQLSLLWFGSDPKQFKRWHNRFNKEFIDFRREFIGTSSKPKKQGNFESETGSNIFNELIQINKPLAEDVANYFIDMKKVFNRMYLGLKPGGVASVIIGNTTLKGVKINNAEVAAEQMLSAGFKRVEFIKRELSSKMITPWRDSNTGKFTGLDNPDKHRIYDFEYVLVMRKPIK
jgi:DNA modification methylase